MIVTSTTLEEKGGVNERAYINKFAEKNCVGWTLVAGQSDCQDNPSPATHSMPSCFLCLGPKILRIII